MGEMLQGSHERELGSGGILTPAVEPGIRFDDGDIGQGPGLEATHRPDGGDKLMLRATLRW